MQVKITLPEKSALTSSSFTIKISIKTESLKISFIKANSINWLIKQLKETLKNPRKIAAGAQLTEEAIRALAKVIAISVMASNAKTDDNLGTDTATVISIDTASETRISATQSDDTTFTLTGDKDEGKGIFQQLCKRKSSDDRIIHKRKWIKDERSNESNSDGDVNRVVEEEDEDNDAVEKIDKNTDDAIGADDNDDDDNDCKTDKIFQSSGKEQGASQLIRNAESSSASVYASKSVEADCKDEALHDQFAESNKVTPVHTYVAPEQALVTRVELVVPAPMSAPSAASAAAAVAAVFESVSHNSSSNLQYDSDVVFNASSDSSATLLKNEAIENNGCATDSSKLNVRIPTNITLSATGDILSTDRRAAIWAPHDEYKDTQNHTQIHEDTPGSGSLLDMEQSRGHLHHGSEPDHLQIGAVSEAYQQDIYSITSHQHRQEHQHQHEQQLPLHQDQQQQRQSLLPPSELLLQIEKEAGVVGFGQMHQLHHHTLAQQHFNHQESSFQNNMYAQMIQQHQHQQQHHLHHSLQHHNIHNEHQQHFASYGHHQHYSQDQLFNIHHPPTDQCQTQSQQQQQPLPQSHIECHDNLQQQQRTAIQQGADHPQHQMQDAYHDLMMDEYHEDPATTYKLTLSPSNAKTENQDDGYETSAGDVLTPNSHSSSTHSITPQHQMYHSGHGHAPQNKREEHLIAQNSTQSQSVASISSNTRGGCAPQLPVKNSIQARGVVLPSGPYSFMGDEMRVLSPEVPIISNASSYAPVMPSSVSESISGSVSTSVTASVSTSAPIQALTCNDAEKRDDLYKEQSLIQNQQLGNSKNFVGSLDSASKQSLDGENSNCGTTIKSGPATRPVDGPEMSPLPLPKRRGRKKKLIGTDMEITASQNSGGTSACKSAISSNMLTIKPKERKKHDRFNGMSEAEVIQRTIPDHLCDNLDIVIVGINPGLFAAYKGHHYAGPGNHFWKCLYLSGLTQEQLSAEDDHTLLKHGIGFTNMVARATKGSADLTRKEIKEGSRILQEKLIQFRPKVAVFNGKLIFEVFSGKKEFHFGRQPDRVEGTDTYIWVMPSSSARCAQLPRAADKVPFYAALKKFRDFLNGLIPHMDESECVFTEQRIRQCCESQDLNKGASLSNVKSNDDPIPNNTNVVDGHTDQQSSHIYSDSNHVDGTAESSKQVIDELYPHINANISNGAERDEFVYGNNDATIRSVNRVPTTGRMIPGPGARPESISDTDYMSVFENHHQQQPQPLPEKKKRGRPKKLKGQEIIDPSTGKKITISGQSMTQHNFNNILNLSLITNDNSQPVLGRAASIGVTGCSSAENTTKKKRGRPKKVKPILENMLTSSTVKQQHVNVKPSSNLIAVTQPQQTTLITTSMHPHSMEHIASPQGSHQAPPSLYNTPPPSHMLYTASASPMASPALNCSYSHSHGTPPVVQVDHHLQTNTDHPSQSAAPTVGIRDQPHLVETPPPSSPNMCAVVDFDPPNERNDELESGLAMSQQACVTGRDEDGHAHTLDHSHDHYQQWLSSNHHLHQSTQKVVQQQGSLQSQSQVSPVTVSSYPQTDQQQVNMPASLQYHSEQHGQHWQSYEDHGHNNSPYILSSPQQQHTHINQSTQLVGNAQPAHVVSDVSRKSLSGLESLVDQIPSISEQESNVMSSVTAAAAAAAVENRLIGLQQQQQHQEHQKRCLQVTEAQSESTTGNNSNVLTSNFSVSNLTASSSLTNHLIHNNSNNNSSSRSEIEDNSKKSNVIEYISNGSNSHPSNHLISAALVAATVGSSQPSVAQHHSITPQHSHSHTHPHPHAHTQMYMDHTHITSHMAHMPPVNAMYAPPYGAQHGASAAEYGHNHYSVQGVAPTLHVPSPNYAYTHYGHTPPQSNYPSFGHAHPHHHHHGHTAHHLSVFERLKPSDISGYSGF